MVRSTPYPTAAPPPAPLWCSGFLSMEFPLLCLPFPLNTLRALPYPLFLGANIPNILSLTLTNSISPDIVPSLNTHTVHSKFPHTISLNRKI